MNDFIWRAGTIYQQATGGIPSFRGSQGYGWGCFTRYKAPVHEKGQRKLLCDRASAKKVDILYPILAGQVHKMMLGDVHAAGKGRISIADENLAVGPQIDGKLRWNEGWGKKIGHLDLGTKSFLPLGQWVE